MMKVSFYIFEKALFVIKISQSYGLWNVGQWFIIFIGNLCHKFLLEVLTDIIAISFQLSWSNQKEKIKMFKKIHNG